jgi:hypothetical protein
VADRWCCISQKGFGAQPNISASRNECMWDVSSSELEQCTIQSDAFWTVQTSFLSLHITYLEDRCKCVTSSRIIYQKHRSQADGHCQSFFYTWKKVFNNRHFHYFLPMTLPFSYAVFPGILFYSALSFPSVCYKVVLICLLRKSICYFFSKNSGVSFHTRQNFILCVFLQMKRSFSNA